MVHSGAWSWTQWPLWAPLTQDIACFAAQNGQTLLAHEGAARQNASTLSGKNLIGLMLLYHRFCKALGLLINKIIKCRSNFNTCVFLMASAIYSVMRGASCWARARQGAAAGRRTWINTCISSAERGTYSDYFGNQNAPLHAWVPEQTQSYVPCWFSREKDRLEVAFVQTQSQFQVLPLIWFPPNTNCKPEIAMQLTLGCNSSFRICSLQKLPKEDADNSGVLISYQQCLSLLLGRRFLLVEMWDL